jgi:hypothetical protein
MKLNITDLAANRVEMTIGDWTVSATTRVELRALALGTGPFTLELGRLALTDVEASDGTRRVEVSRLTLDVQVQGGDDGTTVWIRGGHGDELQAALGGPVLRAARLELPGELTIGGGEVRCGALRLDEVELELGEGRAVRARSLALPGAALAPGSPELLAISGPLTLTEVSYGDPRATVQLDRLELPQGLRYGESGLDIDGVNAGALSATLSLGGDDGGEEGQGGEGQGGAGSAPSDAGSAVPPADPTAAADPAAEAQARGQRFRLLDGLQGQLDVDLYIDATYPVYGERKVTHHFRIPIADGAIDYKKLEKSLATLEDAVLDIELLPGELILEKDLPLVPFDNQTLVRWRLEPHEQALAAVQRVRLSTLLKAELPEPDKSVADRREKDGKGPLQLHRLELRELDLRLEELSKGGVIDLGSAGRLRFVVDGGGGDAKAKPLEDLRVHGVLRHVTAGDTSPGELQLGCARLRCDLEALQTGDRALSARGLQLEGLDHQRSKLSFDGLEPKELTLAVASLSATDLRLGQPPTAPLG